MPTRWAACLQTHAAQMPCGETGEAGEAGAALWRRRETRNLLYYIFCHRSDGFCVLRRSLPPGAPPGARTFIVLLLRHVPGPPRCAALRLPSRAALACPLRQRSAMKPRAALQEGHVHLLARRAVGYLAPFEHKLDRATMEDCCCGSSWRSRWRPHCQCCSCVARWSTHAHAQTHQLQ